MSKVDDKYSFLSKAQMKHKSLLRLCLDNILVDLMSYIKNNI